MKKQVTARCAFSKSIETQIKHQKRGYGYRVMIINECPDCNGYGLMEGDAQICCTCGNYPDQAENLVKHGKKWYAKLVRAERP
jgi:hypothetical protein